MQPPNPVPPQATPASPVDTSPADMARSETRTVSTASRQVLDGVAPIATEQAAAPLFDQATDNAVTPDQAGHAGSHIRVGHVARRQRKHVPSQWRREPEYFAPQGYAYRRDAYQGYAYESAPFYRPW
jgi:hypothetical protein